MLKITGTFLDEITCKEGDKEMNTEHKAMEEIHKIRKKLYMERKKGAQEIFRNQPVRELFFADCLSLPI